MVKTGKIKIFLMVPLFIILVWWGVSSNMAWGQTDPFSEMQEKLEGVSAEKKEILENLFNLAQEMEEIKREEAVFAGDIEIIRLETEELERRITDEEMAFKKKRDVLKQVLRSYQKRGPGTYLEIMLNSDNMSTFLKRLNVFRDLARNTGEILDALEESKGKLALERSSLAEKLFLMENKQESLRKNLAKMTETKEEMERYLQSLEEDSDYYREQLADIEKSWSRLKKLFPEITKEISRIIEEGDFPPDAWNISFTLKRIRGSIDEKTFNDIIAGNSLLAEMTINFTPGKAKLTFPQKNLVLTGKFDVREGKILKFEAEEGFFYGLPLAAGSIKDLFRENYLLFNFKTPLGNSNIHSIKISEGALEFEIIPALF